MGNLNPLNPVIIMITKKSRDLILLFECIREMCRTDYSCQIFGE